MFTDVRRPPLQIENGPRESADIHGQPSSSANLAVILAVRTPAVHQFQDDQSGLKSGLVESTDLADVHDTIEVE
jgi:hypothetical protein